MDAPCSSRSVVLLLPLCVPGRRGSEDGGGGEGGRLEGRVRVLEREVLAVEVVVDGERVAARDPVQEQHVVKSPRLKQAAHLPRQRIVARKDQAELPPPLKLLLRLPEDLGIFFGEDQ
jgi:hypothetical protein